MTRRRGELRLQLLGALFDGEREIEAILGHIGEPLDGRRKCEVVLRRLLDGGFVSRRGDSYGLTLQGRGYIRELREVLGA